MRCVICDKTKDEVSLMLQGENGKCLCNNCIESYSALLNSFSVKLVPKDSAVKIVKPSELKRRIDKKVVGHDKTKKILSLAFYDQIMKYNGFCDNSKLGNNVIIVGPTGVGKTYLLETIAELVNLPMIICDSTSYSEIGYSGLDVDTMIGELFERANYDVKKTEYGIIFVDEIDKIGRKGEFHSYSRDVSGEGVQQSLLKMVEGKNVVVSKRGRNGVEEKILINTTNIMFVFGGAFVGINEEKEIENALINYGMIPELVGRMNYLTTLQRLTKKELRQIICEIDDSILELQRQRFMMDNISLSMDELAIDYLVDIAEKKELGARGIITVLNEVLCELRYTALEEGLDECNVSYEYVKKIIC